jgi:hypothetical protein
MTTINVNDLAMVVKIIDLGSTSGIFKGPDLKPVGDLRERIVAFVQEVEAANKEQANANPTTE